MHFPDTDITDDRWEVNDVNSFLDFAIYRSDPQLVINNYEMKFQFIFLTGHSEYSSSSRKLVCLHLSGRRDDI